jgi:hypothetical protein
MDPGMVQLFNVFVNVGLVDVLLPFAIVFAIVFGILEKTKVLGKDNPNVNQIVAFSIASLFVISLNLVNLMNRIIWVFTIAVVMVICLVLIMGLFGIHPSKIFRKK